MLNGNKIKNTKLNLLQINKGNSNFQTKLNEINSTIQTYHPDIMCISEANLKQSNKSLVNKYPDYNFEFNKLSNSIDISRNILMINSKIAYKRRLDLEENSTCTIWIQINIPKKKPILVCGIK